VINLDCIHGANSGNQNHMSISDNQIQHWLIWYLKSNHYSHRLTAKTHKVEAIFKPHTKKKKNSIFNLQSSSTKPPTNQTHMSMSDNQIQHTG
jgi:hypothetical protein